MCCVAPEDTFFLDTIKDMFVSMVFWEIKIGLKFRVLVRAFDVLLDNVCWIHIHQTRAIHYNIHLSMFQIVQQLLPLPLWSLMCALLDSHTSPFQHMLGETEVGGILGDHLSL